MSVNVLARDRAVHPAASFASGDKIRVKGGQAVNAIGAITIVWLGKPDASRDANWRNLISGLDSGGAWNNGYAVELDTSNHCIFGRIIGGISAANVASTTTTVAADGPCLHVITKVGGTNTPIYYRYKYLTGVWVVENFSGTLQDTGAPTQIEIGGDLGGSGDFFVGDIYAAAYYTRALVQGEIIPLAHSFTAWALQGLVGFWRLRGKEYVTDLAGFGAIEQPGSRVGIKQSAYTVGSLPMPRIDDRQPRERIWASIAGGGTTYNVTLTATQGQAAVSVRSIGAIRSAGQSQSVTITRAAARTLSAVQTQTLALTRSATRTLSLTQSQSPTVTRSAAATRRATSSSSVTVTRSIGKVLSAAQAQAVALSRQGGRILAASATGLAIRIVQAARSMTVTQPQSATRVAAIAATRRANVTGTATVVSGNARTVTLTAAVTATVSVVRSIGKVLRPTQGQSVSLTRAAQRILSLAQTTSVQRTVQRSTSLPVAQGSVATVKRTRPKTLTATVTSIATLLKHSFILLRASIAGRIADDSEGRIASVDEGEPL